jgi:outer membrane receptor protein involved in Fe transport
MWAWKVGLDWQIVENLRFRATRSRDVRAANLNERFNTTLETITVDDPFRGETVVDVIGGGNPEVDPEASDTITFGFVYEPSWAEGLSSSIDYYDIDIGDAITFVGVGNILNGCFELNEFCDLIERGPPGPDEALGPIRTVHDQFVNAQSFRARGADLELSYRPSFRPLDGVLMTRMLVTHVDETSFARPGGVTIERAGTGFVPEWSGTLSLIWVRDPVVISLSERWRDGVVTNLNWVEGVDVDQNEVAFQHVTNLRATYNFDGWDGAFSLYGSVRNLFNRNPGDVDGRSNIYSDIGRSYSLGLRYEFGESSSNRRRPSRRR